MEQIEKMPEKIYVTPKGSGTVSGVWVDMKMDDEPRGEFEYIRADIAASKYGLSAPVENNLQEISDRAMQWRKEAFGERLFTAPLHHLKKEIQEVIEAEAEDHPHAGSLIEFADCLLLLLDAFCLCHPDLNTSDLLRAASNKIEINKKRKWGKPDEHGAYQHIEPNKLSTPVTETFPKAILSSEDEQYRWEREAEQLYPLITGDITAEIGKFNESQLKQRGEYITARKHSVAPVLSPEQIKEEAEKLYKSLIRSACEGYRDVNIEGKKRENFHALMNVQQMKEWIAALSAHNKQHI